MSHDADKLIRQLSLVAFLMAERRPLLLEALNELYRARVAAGTR